MSSLFDKILQWKINKERIPYGHTPPLFLKEIIHNIDNIIIERADFLQQMSSLERPISELSKEQADLDKDKKWKALFLYGYNHYHTKAIHYFPTLRKIIEKHKDEIIMLMFSTLEPQKKLHAHHGNNHTVLRAQIGIDIPQPNRCGLRVEDKTFHLENKKTLVFDDTFEHEAWNLGDKTRTIMIIDYAKPLSFPFSILNKWKIEKIKKSPYIQDVIKKM